MSKQPRKKALTSEKRREIEIARDYEKRGYQVLTQPSLPFSNANVRPDLIALSDDDKVVIEVVTSPALQDNDRVKTLAGLVEQQPGWRFELVVVMPLEDSESLPNPSSIQKIIEDGGRLVHQYPRAALLLLWSAIEALLRQRLQASDSSVQSNSPIAMVKTLYSRGILSRASFDTLQESAKLRNSVAHGVYTGTEAEVSRMTTNTLTIVQNLLAQVKDDNTLYTVDDLMTWFLDNYEDPVHNVPYEGGYVYMFGGPYDAWEELFSQFPDVDETIIDKAAERLIELSYEWVKKGQY